jgi:phospholipase/carboxylesterase
MLQTLAKTDTGSLGPTRMCIALGGDSDMKLLETVLGGLSCRVLDGSDDGADLRAICVMCHGFGAPGDDLVGLAPEILRLRPELARHVRFIFPTAPIDLGPMYFGGRAWWHVDVGRYASATTEDDIRALTAPAPEGLTEARRKLHALIDEVLATSGLPMSRVFLGGFSQGAMLALDTTLRLDEPPAALFVLSGALIARDEWTRLVNKRAGLSVLQTHGRQDPVLPFVVAEWLRELLVDAGWDVDFKPFDGPHTIPLEALTAIADRLAEQILD